MESRLLYIFYNYYYTIICKILHQCPSDVIHYLITFILLVLCCCLAFTKYILSITWILIYNFTYIFFEYFRHNFVCFLLSLYLFIVLKIKSSVNFFITFVCSLIYRCHLVFTTYWTNIYFACYIFNPQYHHHINLIRNYNKICI